MKRLKGPGWYYLHNKPVGVPGTFNLQSVSGGTVKITFDGSVPADINPLTSENMYFEDRSGHMVVHVVVRKAVCTRSMGGLTTFDALETDVAILPARDTCLKHQSPMDVIRIDSGEPSNFKLEYRCFGDNEIVVKKVFP